MTTPLDTSDRAALAAWLFAVWRCVQAVVAIATNATRPALRIPADIAGKVVSDAVAQLDVLFAQLRPLLRDGGVPTAWEPGLATPEDMTRHDVIVRARWDAKQAALPPEKRRTWEQACADDEAHMGRALRRAAKDGGP